MKPLIIATAIALGSLAAAPAFASDEAEKAETHCAAPKAEWRSEDALRAHLTAQGWKIEEIETDDGCYEVEGVNKAGQSVEAKFDPKSFDMLANEKGD